MDANQVISGVVLNHTPEPDAWDRQARRLMGLLAERLIRMGADADPNHPYHHLLSVIQGHPRRDVT